MYIDYIHFCMFSMDLCKFEIRPITVNSVLLYASSFALGLMLSQFNKTKSYCIDRQNQKLFLVMSSSETAFGMETPDYALQHPWIYLLQLYVRNKDSKFTMVVWEEEQEVNINVFALCSREYLTHGT